MEKVKLVVAMLIVGSIGIFVHFIPLPSAVIAMFRAVVGTLFLLGVMIFKQSNIDWAVVKKNAKYLIISGTAIGFNWIFLFEAYQYTSVAVATLCYYMAPAFVVLLAPFVLNEKMTIYNLFSTISALFGAVLISGVFGGVQVNLIGVGYGIGAAGLYACIMILNKKTKGLPGLELTFFQLLVSAVVMVPYVFLTEDLSGLSFTPSVLGLLLIVGVVHTGWVYQLFFEALNKLPAQTSSLLSYIDPVTAIILSAVLLHQPLSTIQMVGTLFILGSAVMNEVFNFRKQRSSVLKQSENLI